MAYFEAKDVSVAYQMPTRVIRAVDHVSFTLEKGQSLGLVGESGSGKSTFGMAALRLLDEKTAAVTGQILLDGRDLLTLDDQALHLVRWQTLSAVFQKSMNALSPVHKIGAQMADVYLCHKKTSKDEAKKRVLETLKLVGLGERVYNAYPHELSGGMMQRTAIALSLLLSPEMIIFDEATTALDRITQGQILEQIVSLEKLLGLTRIMITHDISVVASTCTHIAVLYAGRLMEVGETRKVLSHPRHPYTKGLLGAFPSLTGEKKPLTGIPGTLPDLGQPIPGCPFAPRCAYAKRVCREEMPGVQTLPTGVRCACHFPLKEDADA